MDEATHSPVALIPTMESMILLATSSTPSCPGIKAPELLSTNTP